MSAQIAAICKLLTSEIDLLELQERRGTLSQSETRFLQVFATLRVELAMLRMTAQMEAARAAETIIATGATESPERGGMGPGSV